MKDIKESPFIDGRKKRPDHKGIEPDIYQFNDRIMLNGSIYITFINMQTWGTFVFLIPTLRTDR